MFEAASAWRLVVRPTGHEFAELTAEEQRAWVAASLAAQEQELATLVGRIARADTPRGALEAQVEAGMADQEDAVFALLDGLARDALDATREAYYE